MIYQIWIIHFGVIIWSNVTLIFDKHGMNSLDSDNSRKQCPNNESESKSKSLLSNEWNQLLVWVMLGRGVSAE